MSKVIELPYFTIDANQLATWLESQPDKWWIVDGDPVLTSQVDFPCPSDELSEALRREDKKLYLFDPRKNSNAKGDSIHTEGISDVADTSNNSRSRTFLLSWEDDSSQWLLSEDLAAGQ